MDKDIEELFDQGLDQFNIDVYDEAIKIFKKVLEMNPDHPDALYYIALAWANKSDYSQAITDFTKALEKDPFDTDSLIGRGQAWQSKGNVKRALADFKKALDIDPDNPDYQVLIDELEEK
jgi:tetratricopeptide (TPR) repeat protein